MDYMEQIAALPVPTTEQTARFADHVANNHSWYKHLPFFPPGASFVVFPNPHAGRGVRSEADQFAVYDIEQGDYFQHHSRLATRDYLDLFGHWDYWQDEYPCRFDLQNGPWLFDVGEGQMELFPQHLKQRWSCRLTAFVKPSLDMFRLRPNELTRELEAFEAYARDHAGQPIVSRYRMVSGENAEVGESSWGSDALLAFKESECRAQKKILLGTLNRVRSDWVEAQHGRAEH